LKTVSLLESTCPFNSRADLSAARERKQEKPEYQQIVAELDCLGLCVTTTPLKLGALAITLKRQCHLWKKFQIQDKDIT